MMTYNTKRNLIEEAVPASMAELDEEMLENISGGLTIGPYGDMRARKKHRKREDPKDGGATGSW